VIVVMPAGDVRAVVGMRRLVLVAVSHGAASVMTGVRIVAAGAPCAPLAWAAEQVLP
jgi:hypothetical protein